MSAIDKQSVRKEFYKIKASFQEQVAAGKVSTDVATLFNALMMLVNIILSIFMEKTTKKTSANSSIPPSQTTPDDTSITTKSTTSENQNKQKTVTVAGNTRTVETVILLPVLACETCGTDLQEVECKCIERRTTIDILFEKTEDHVDAEVKQCPACDTTVKAKFPANLLGPLQYGNGIKAYVIELLIVQMIALNRVAVMVSFIIDRMISPDTMLGFILRLHVALADWESKAKRQLMSTQCIHVDETSLRVDKKNYWIHVYSAGEITLKFLHQKRGKEAIEDINIIPHYSGIIIHDCWASYLSYSHLEHGLCGSHLLRELAFIVDSNGYRWAKNMKRLLREVCKMVSRRQDKCLTSSEYLKLERLYQKILARGEEELPPIPEKTTKRRGKVAQSEAHNLWERL